ncbi:MAG: hypothetical protein M3N98_08485 [Actinomycetota bacterium]|nr:hypothetical protein [Actinomycetota bacterium]
MISRPGSALRSVVVLPLVEGYRHLSAAEVMADLPVLGPDDLHLVQSLEQMAGCRPEIVERIADLLNSLDERQGRADPAPPSQAPVVECAAHGRWRRPSHWGRRTRLISSVAAIVVTTGVPLAVYVRDGAPGAVVRTAGSPTISATTQPARDRIEQLLVGAPPSYTQQADATSNGGPSDLTKAAIDDGAPGARSVLTRDGFAHGFQRTWLSADHSQITVLVYRFKGAGGAAAYARDMISKGRSDPRFIADFVVSGIPGAVGEIAAATGDVTATVFMSKGPMLVRVAVNAVSDTGLVATAQELARAQYGRV